MSESIDFKIECYTRFSWGYVYWKDDIRHQIWADSAQSLKRKVLSKNLPWDDSMVPEVKPTRITGVGLIAVDSSPAQFRLPWCKSNYKRY